MNENSYLKDHWNKLDFAVVVSAYLPLILKSDAVNLSVLRSFRVIRPLRAISNIRVISKFFDSNIFFYTIFIKI
jgi:hypothetical protein